MHIVIHKTTRQRHVRYHSQLQSDGNVASTDTFNFVSPIFHTLATQVSAESSKRELMGIFGAGFYSLETPPVTEPTVSKH